MDKELRIAERIVKALYPARAYNVNKVKDKEGLWNAKIEDTDRMFGLRFAPKDIGDIIFYLNMVASQWDNEMARRNK